MYFFFELVSLFSIENAKFWLVLAILSIIYALFGAPFTGLNSVMVPKNLTNIRYVFEIPQINKRFPKWTKPIETAIFAAKM